MTRRPPRSTRTDTPFPYTTLFRSHVLGNRGRPFAAPSDTGVDRTLPRPFRHGLGSSPQPYSRKTEEAWDSSCRYTVGPAARGHSRMVVAFRGRASTLRPPDGGVRSPTPRGRPCGRTHSGIASPAGRTRQHPGDRILSVRSKVR